MVRPEDIKRDMVLTGVVPGQKVTVVDVGRYGPHVIELTYKDESGSAVTSYSSVTMRRSCIK